MINVNTDLIARAQKGDSDVIAALYEGYHLSIFRYLYYRVGDMQTAEDLTSEVFERMMRFIAGFKPPSATFQAWLFQIARNLATDYFRKNGARDHWELEESMTADYTDLDATIDRRLTSETLRQALSRLTDEQRDVILMRFIAGMPIFETAQALDKSEDAVKGLQRRALMSLRKILSDWEVSYV
jgi:RNA polymerase sigma-70 factor (ECF subfamily)